MTFISLCTCLTLNSYCSQEGCPGPSIPQVLHLSQAYRPSGQLIVHSMYSKRENESHPVTSRAVTKLFHQFWGLVGDAVFTCVGPLKRTVNLVGVHVCCNINL